MADSWLAELESVFDTEEIREGAGLANLHRKLLETRPIGLVEFRIAAISKVHRSISYASHDSKVTVRRDH